MADDYPWKGGNRLRVRAFKRTDKRVRNGQVVLNSLKNVTDIGYIGSNGLMQVDVRTNNEEVDEFNRQIMEDIAFYVYTLRDQLQLLSPQYFKSRSRSTPVVYVDES